MTLEEVEAAVEHIRGVAGDAEEAHSSEDDLWRRVLKAIADGASNPAELAAAALRTEAIAFSRWYA